MNFTVATPQVSATVQDPASVDAAISSRFSARAYLNKPVDRAVLQEVLEIAARAPSGTNTQPWKVYVLQGAKRDELVAKACAAHDAMAANPALAAEYAEEYDYYPAKWVSPFIDRRRECGFGLYSVLGIGKGDKERMHQQHQQNFRFFDAPVGLIFTRHVFADPDGGGPLARPAHLPAGGVEQLLQDRAAPGGRGRERDDGLRHGAGLCRRVGPGQYLPDHPCERGRLHPLGGVIGFV